MLSRELNETNDIFFRAGRSAWLKDSEGQGIERVMQSLRCRLNFYTGEWFLDETAGTPWRQQILVKPVNLSLVESIIKNRILTTYGVNNLLRFFMNFTAATRTLDIIFTIDTIYGTITDRITTNG
jgi:hypothetical protein